jgi:hypothetical protein
LSDDDILEEARAAFQLAADAEAENRRDALDDLRFARLGEQWPEKVRREREMEGRPCLTINRLPTFIRQVGDHESRCEERLSEIKTTVASTLQAIEGLKSRSWGIAAALLAWALAQLWSANAVRVERLEVAAATRPLADAKGETQ